MCYLPIASCLFDVPLKLGKNPIRFMQCCVLYCSQTFMLTVGYTIHHALHARMPERTHYRTHKRTRTRTRTGTRICTLTHTHTPVHMHICPHTDTQTHTRTHELTLAHLHTHRPAHGHTRTHQNVCNSHSLLFIQWIGYLLSTSSIILSDFVFVFFLYIHDIEIFLISFIFCFYSVLQISTNVVILVV